MKQRRGLVDVHKRACDHEKPNSIKRTKSLPTPLLPEHAGRPLFWFLAKGEENNNHLMLSSSSCMEMTETSDSAELSPDEITMVQQDRGDDTDLSCTLSLASSDGGSFLNASDTLLGLDFLMEDDEDSSAERGINLLGTP